MVNQIVIPFHSIVDIITNSSTVIYTGVQESAKSAIRNIINHILEQAGSDKEALDLYDIKVYEKLESEPTKVFEQISATFSYSSTVAKTAIVVTPKNNPEDDYVTEMLGKLFYVEEEYH